ncbi:YkvA family protein [Rhizobium sp. S152]|uniref:YkvA family protein n=1 Tax=Rhizobium sp. S152 TaxID=3055038 RepID=UPI0025A96B77|nr:YkvA family protein [Rhizobium sp. S152]MDM9624264.1 YkvA family protein [Rhizobium sp. S152]
MDDVKYGEILLPGDEDTQSRREETVRRKFWPTFRKAARRIPFSRDLVAAFYCALDPQTPLKVRGTLLAALAYFVLPVDMIPDVLVGIGFTDDIAVLSAAFAMVSRNIRPNHYEAADKALDDKLDNVKPENMKSV